MNEKRKDNIKILPLSTDHMMQRVANQYAEHLLHQGPDETVLNEFIENHEAMGAPDTLCRVKGNFECIVGEAFYDAEADDEEGLQDVFKDAHGLLFEFEKELNILLRPEFTHIAIGLAFTQNQVKVVEILTVREVRVLNLSATADEGIEVKGQVLNMEKHGIYAVRVVN